MDNIRETIIARAEQLGLTAYAIAKAIQDANGETVPDVGTVRRYLTGRVSLNSRYVSLICDVLGLELRVASLTRRVTKNAQT